ncbi:dpy-19-like 1 (C. elegans) (predicted), isoform CRA_c [Rattus norvegicus]|uniref:Dpy-19-like 1 (C. elegans) (Predicted), isoform CRA_c n=1 Tax=Rattus norvegicus TaxID=10116 RepID=A6JYA5_RAT|nr:dpy-19-like 1 (C. elegans) (predicted), isoform CRA_c [Rattus norvegicus]
MQKNGNRDRRGWEGHSPCLLHSHSAAQHGCCVDTAVRIFFNHLLKVIFCPYPLTIPFTISSRVMMGNSVQRNKILKYY